ncbi:MAG: hypothetical protein KBS38_00270 [Bacteroidales bacterium]|nr:hypothetical protein [Candidatus Cacconaster caballi]
MYHPLHEADLEKFVSIADRIIDETVRTAISAYEQKSQNFANANFRTVSRLESVLNADFREI